MTNSQLSYAFKDFINKLQQENGDWTELIFHTKRKQNCTFFPIVVLIYWIQARIHSHSLPSKYYCIP